MQAHSNPFLMFGQFDFFKKALAKRGPEALEKVFSNTTESALVNGARIRHRVFSPLTTLWLFILQILEGDHSCRNIVSLWVAKLSALGQKSCSLRTGAFVRAREKLCEAALETLAQLVAGSVEQEVSQSWLWKKRAVKLVDGTTVSMPDTRANQQAYPQPRSQKKGLGFPLMRVVAVISLSSGVVLDLALGKCLGKGAAEISFFRRLRGTFKKGDLLLFDRLYATYADLAYLIREGVDFVGRLGPTLEKKLKRLESLGSSDGIYYLEKYSERIYKGMANPEPYAEIPEWIIVRVISVQVGRRGYRTRRLKIITSLLELKQASRQEIAELYGERWQVELDLRTIKSAMNMDILRCKTPEMVRKEIWVHILAYNLLRMMMAEVACLHTLQPRKISVQATRQLLNHLLPLLMIATASQGERLQSILMDKLLTEQIGRRKKVCEPRAIKRRPKQYPRLQQPRTQARRALRANGA